MIPHLSIFRTCICSDDGEAEGWAVQFCWLRFMIEVTIARFEVSA